MPSRFLFARLNSNPEIWESSSSATILFQGPHLRPSRWSLDIWKTEIVLLRSVRGPYKWPNSRGRISVPAVV